MVNLEKLRLLGVGEGDYRVATEAADKIERLTAALSSCESWVERWTSHVGNCKGSDKCTCGRSAVLYEANEALNQQSTLTEK